MSKSYKGGADILDRMVEAIEKIEQYIKNTDEADFITQQEFFDAICMQFALLGELTNNLDDSADNIIRNFPDEVNWSALIGLRNRISHNYVSVDPTLIWQFATTEVSDIKESLIRLLKKRYGRRQ